MKSMETEGVKHEFSDDAIRRLAEIVRQVDERTEAPIGSTR